MGWPVSRVCSPQRHFRSFSLRVSEHWELLVRSEQRWILRKSFYINMIRYQWNYSDNDRENSRPYIGISLSNLLYEKKKAKFGGSSRSTSCFRPTGLFRLQLQLSRIGPSIVRLDSLELFFLWDNHVRVCKEFYRLPSCLSFETNLLHILSFL